MRKMRQRFKFPSRIVSGVVLMLLLLQSTSGPIQAASGDGTRPATQQDGSFSCTPAPAVKPPPFEVGPKPISVNGENPGVATLKPDTFKPVCPDGQVPKPKETFGAPKGNPLLSDGKKFTFDEIYKKDNKGQQPPPPPPGPGTPDCGGVAYFGNCYYYGSAGVRREADGGGMTTSVQRPTYVYTGRTGHTLNEIAIQGGPSDGNIVELGWNVSSDQYGDLDPHLFVYHWNGMVGSCYDGCGWVQYSTVYFPRMNLSAIIGRSVYIGYVYYEGNWWAWFDNQWLGYFPGSLWGGTFSRTTQIQWFGEVASLNGIPPRTDMGNGLFGTDPSAAWMSTLCDVDAAAWVCWYRDEQFWSSTRPEYYNIVHSGFGQMRYGGPGE